MKFEKSLLLLHKSIYVCYHEEFFPQTKLILAFDELRLFPPSYKQTITKMNYLHHFLIFEHCAAQNKNKYIFMHCKLIFVIWINRCLPDIHTYAQFFMSGNVAQFLMPKYSPKIVSSTMYILLRHFAVFEHNYTFWCKNSWVLKLLKSYNYYYHHHAWVTKHKFTQKFFSNSNRLEVL